MRHANSSTHRQEGSAVVPGGHQTLGQRALGEHALIAGPPRSGKTTALLALAACAAHLHPGLELIGVAGRRSPLAESPLLARTVSGAQALEALVVQLRDKPGDEAAARLIFIDDADAVQDPSRRLADALTAPGGFHVVAAGRGDGLSALGHWSYHVLADLLGQPGLRRRAARRMRAILAGQTTRARSEPVLWRYGVASLCWSALTVAFAIAMSLRYYHRLVSVAPRAVVWTLLAAFYIVLALPIALTVLAPLRRRRPPARVIGDA